MEKMFTRLTGTILLTSLLFVGFTAKAQTTAPATSMLASTDVKSDKKPDQATTEAKPASTTETKTTAKPAEDTTWKPQRRVWGYTFGDFYYNAHADAANRGPETNYAGV